MAKKKFVKIVQGDKVLSVYDLYKVSKVFRVNDKTIEIIIDSVSETWAYPDKDTCDRNYDWIVNELFKLDVD